MEKNEAVFFVECLAKGVNPLTGDALDDESIFNDAKFVRKLYALKDFLEENILEKKIKKTPFVLKIKENIVNGPMNISAFVERINEVNVNEYMKKLTRASISDWLIKNDYLVVIDGEKKVTKKGSKEGIYLDKRISMYGREYDVFMYPPKLLKQILDLIQDGTIN